MDEVRAPRASCGDNYPPEKRATEIICLGIPAVPELQNQFISRIPAILLTLPMFTTFLTGHLSVPVVI